MLTGPGRSAPAEWHERSDQTAETALDRSPAPPEQLIRPGALLASNRFPFNNFKHF